MDRSSVVTGQSLRMRYRGGALLRDVFEDIERELKDSQRVVCQFIVNGLAIEEKDEARFAGIGLHEVETLEYLSESMELLSVGVVEEWIRSVPELQRGAEALAERLKAGQAQGILKALHDIVENCELLVTSLHSIRGMAGDEAMVHAFERFVEIERQNRTVLYEALRHLRGRDFVQLALVLEYDLNHVLEEWMGLLKGLSAILHERAGGRHDDGTTANSVVRGRGSDDA